MALSIRALATALGVAKSAVQRDAARGMPTSSVEAAAAWRQLHVNVAASTGARLGWSLRRVACPSGKATRHE